jgi:K+-sensing histidine kinase KdpD
MHTYKPRLWQAMRLIPLLRAGLVGLACAAAATALRESLDIVAPNMASYQLVFPAVLLATLASGVIAGSVSLVAGFAAADFFFVTPRLSFQPETLTHGLSMAVTAIALVFGLWVAARSKRAAPTLAGLEEGHNTAALTGRAVTRRARFGEAHLVEELGQRLAAIGLAAHALRTDGANPKAIATIELALDEAWCELKLKGLGQIVEHD